MTTTPTIATPEIWSIAKLFEQANLTIPGYQRPYKWTSKHVYQLVSDIKAHQGKSAYRLGTIIFHAKDNCLNIVDGQQRIITLLLLLKAISDDKKLGVEQSIKDNVEALCEKLSFKNEISKNNIARNYSELKKLVSQADFSEQTVDFLLKKCQVVTFELSDISEAFQFFDAQNSRGKALAPHDLLKAFHLREFSAHDDSHKESLIATWEKIINEEEVEAGGAALKLELLFSEYLYPIHQWLRHKENRGFSKDEIHCFKGVSLEKHSKYPLAKSHNIINFFVNKYNREYQWLHDGQELYYPFQLGSKITNGRRFFERTHHYYGLLQQVKNKGSSLFFQLERKENYEEGKIRAHQVLDTLDNYEGMHRPGDQYVRALFDCLLLLYVDKFHTEQLEAAIIKIFRWAYTVRLENQAVRRETINNHVLKNNLFIVLNDANTPNDFLAHPIEELGKDTPATKVDKLKPFFGIN